MKQVTWELQYLSQPAALRHCRKCGKNTEFISSGQFRINAQRKSLDVWLIYKCVHCDATWNAAIYSRISPKSLAPEKLEHFSRNDSALALDYASSVDFLKSNGAEVGMPAYTIVGESFDPTEAMELRINSQIPLMVKVSALVRSKLHLSQREYEALIDSGGIRSLPEQDLRKCRLQRGVTLLFHSKPPFSLPK